MFNRRHLCFTRQCKSLPLWIVLLSFVTTNVYATVNIGGFIDHNFCYEALLRADVDGQTGLSEDEYVSFAQELSPAGLLDSVLNYQDLPLAFKGSFVSIACLCENPAFGGTEGDKDCCLGDNAIIRIPGPPDAQQSTEDQAFLYATCALTEGAAQAVLTSPSPTLSPSRTPTVSPTQVPSTGPTALRSARPTAQASAAPTQPPTALSSDVPTRWASDVPTAVPTAAPSLERTQVPSLPPTTSSPTRTIAPTATIEPTVPPTTYPSYRPTQQPPPVVRASVSYEIAVSSIDDNEYLSNLQVAMDQLAPEVAARTFDDDGNRRRFLRTTVQFPTEISNVTTIVCPSFWTGTEDVCQEITAVIRLILVDTTVTQEEIVEYENDLFNAIFNGDLQDYLDEISTAVDIFILTGPFDENPDDGFADSNDLSTGARVGIAAAAILLVASLAAYALLKPREQPEPKRSAEIPLDVEEQSLKHQKELKLPELKLPNHNKNADGEDDQPSSHNGSSLYTDGNIGSGSVVQAAETLGAAPANYGRTKALDAGQDMLAEPGMDVAPDSSSNAGSSGWSSSAGLSSLNTGSMDESLDLPPAAPGTTLAGFGAASAIARQTLAKENKQIEETDEDDMDDDDDDDEIRRAIAGPEDVPDMPVVSRKQLDSLIEAGDWAAVGATAALLAAASDSQSMSTRSRGESRSADSGSLDAAKAAELDHLVDAGDWEGVVLAAAKFQAAESGATTSVASSGTGGTGGSPSVSTTVSDSPSRLQKRAEIREEVEALVRRVVPEEIDNVDEMLNQFKGREEELVETLRTMQERAVAQKARTSAHKAAKAEAKRMAQRGRGGTVAQRIANLEGSSSVASSSPSRSTATPVRMPQALSPAPQATNAPSTPLTTGSATASSQVESDGATTGNATESNISSSASGTDSSSKVSTGSQKRTALEMAIEAGDWDAVGEAAMMMSDQSVETMSSGEVDRLANASISQGSSSGQSTLSGVNAIRAAEVDHMISVGDWTGVIAAASRFKESDRKAAATGMSKEEEDALAQAELWMKIAAQKKAAGAMDENASEAAEWAIQRISSQLRERTDGSTAKKQKRDVLEEGDEEDEEDEV